MASPTDPDTEQASPITLSSSSIIIIIITTRMTIVSGRHRRMQQRLVQQHRCSNHYTVPTGSATTATGTAMTATAATSTVNTTTYSRGYLSNDGYSKLLQCSRGCYSTTSTTAAELSECYTGFVVTTCSREHQRPQSIRFHQLIQIHQLPQHKLLQWLGRLASWLDHRAYSWGRLSNRKFMVVPRMSITVGYPRIWSTRRWVRTGYRQVFR